MKVIPRAKIDRLFSPATDYLAGKASIGCLLQGATPVKYARRRAYFTFVYVVRSGTIRGGGFTVVS